MHTYQHLINLKEKYMTKRITKLVCVIISSIVYATNSQAKNKSNNIIFYTDCYSSNQNGKNIFLEFTSPEDKHHDSYVQYINRPRIYLKFISYKSFSIPRARVDMDSYTYAEIINKNITGHYIYTWQMGGTPSLEYKSKKKKEIYTFFPDQGASDSNIPGIACDWSKSSRLSENIN